jgi:hypothetical protein
MHSNVIVADNPAFLLNMYGTTNNPDLSGFSNEHTECMIMIKSGDYRLSIFARVPPLITD